MGMFDTVRCEKPLPGEPKPPEGAWLQTKDFDCTMETYTITAAGKLRNETGDVPFHGILSFYTYEKDVWYEYEAKFTDGNLVDISPVSIYKNAVGGPEKVFYPPPESEEA